MIAFDTNVLVHAHRREMPHHAAARDHLTEAAQARAPWAIPWPCLHEFYSVVTHPRVFRERPSSAEEALAQIRAWLESPSNVVLSEQEGYLEALERLLRPAGIRGPLVHDARIVALCETHGVRVLYSADRDFSRFATPVRITNPFRGETP